MIAAAVVALLTLTCLACGILVLQLAQVHRVLASREYWLWAIALGYGVLGWIVFPLGIAGMLSKPALILLCVLPLPALAYARGHIARPDSAQLTRSEWLLVTVLAIVVALDLVEALVPPTDADSLGYHFALPKDFLAAGRIVFVARTLDGAVPLLTQMTYVPALALGGELGLTLWVMLTGWVSAALLYVLGRRFLNRAWSLAIALVFLTMPAVVFGAGSGQVEVRNALFVMVAAFAVVDARTRGSLGFAVVAGLAAGFFAASKYFGLVFAASCGLALLAQRRWFPSAAAYSIAAILAGGQWYVWNYLHTGDPLFPQLFAALGVADSAVWSRAADEFYRATMLASEDPLAVGFVTFFTAPILAILSPPPSFDAERTGFGPYLLLLLPFVLGGVWQYRRKLLSHPLFVVGMLAVLFYAGWFVLSPYQRLRFLLPVVPLLLIAVTASGVRWSDSGAQRRPLIAATAATLAIQLAVAALFTLDAARSVALQEGRDTFIARKISLAAPISWLNTSLGPDDRVLHFQRVYNYLLDVPNFFGNPLAQQIIDLRPGYVEAARLLRQLKEQRITHIAAAGANEAYFEDHFAVLRAHGCLEAVRQFHDLPIVASRTVATQAAATESLTIYRLKAPCRGSLG